MAVKKEAMVAAVRAALSAQETRTFVPSASRPCAYRRQFDIAVPPKWASQLPRQLTQSFGASLPVAASRPDLLLQAFIHPSFSRDAVKTTMIELEPLGNSIVQLVITELVGLSRRTAPKEPVAAAAATAAINDPRILTDLLCNIWQLDGFVLDADASVPGRFPASPKAAARQTPRVTALPHNIGGACVRAMVAAVYFNGGASAAQAFTEAHVIRPCLTLVCAQKDT